MFQLNRSMSRPYLSTASKQSARSFDRFLLPFRLAETAMPHVAESPFVTNNSCA